MFYRTLTTVTGIMDMPLYFVYLVIMYNTVTTVTVIANDINDFLSYFLISSESIHNCNTVTSVSSLSE